MIEKPKYTTRLQAGLGLVNETMILLNLWSPGMSGGDLNKAALRSGCFPNMSARRLRNIVIECFAPRYLRDQGHPAQMLKCLLPTAAPREIDQLLFLYTCRANPILADFVRNVYWERYADGAASVSKDDARAFIRRAVDSAKTIKRWSDATVVRVANYLLGTCADYGLLGQRERLGRRIVAFRTEPKVAAFLAHELHFRSVGDNSLIANEDWGLFGLGAEDVRSELRRMSLNGLIIFQSAGTVTQISWKHKTLEDFVGALAQN